MRPKQDESSKGTWLKKWKASQEKGELEGPDSGSPDSNETYLGAPLRAVARLSRKALLNNFEVLRNLVPEHEVLPMVKADAYGHGMEWAARTLAREPGLYGFGVATFKEGKELRAALGAQGGQAKIIILSDACPWTDERGEFCEKHSLTPVIADDSDWDAFLKRGWTGRIPYELKFNTGMNRLGISFSIYQKVAKAVGELPDASRPTGVFTHLAVGEDPKHKLTQQQIERFGQIRGAFERVAPGIRYHLANSAGAWNHKELGLAHLTDVIRPGLSLYGIPPWVGAPERGIQPVLTLEATVLHLNTLKPGESMGYGARYRVPTTGPEAKPRTVALLGAGYEDGILRALSGTEKGPGGYVWLGGREERMLGTVSMDLCAVSAAGTVKRGDRAEFLGPNVDTWAQARAAGTIPYELLTSIGNRIRRLHE